MPLKLSMAKKLNKLTKDIAAETDPIKKLNKQLVINKLGEKRNKGS